MSRKKHEDIYPLTIVQMRYGGKYVAFNTEADSRIVIDTQLGEEAMYDTKTFIEKQFYGAYGIGVTVTEALDNLLSHNSL